MKINRWFWITLTFLSLPELLFAAEQEKPADRDTEFTKARIRYEKNPDNAHAAFELGYRYQEQGINNKAKELYERTLALDPKFVAAYINLGNIESARLNYESAESYYLKAIDLNPTHPEAYFNLGALYQNQGKIPEALEQFQKTVALDRNHKAAHLNIATACLKLYTASYQREHLTTAREHLTIAGRLDRSYAHVYFNFGMLHELENQPGIALAYYREALRYYRPESAQYDKTRSRIEYLERAIKR